MKIILDTVLLASLALNDYFVYFKVKGWQILTVIAVIILVIYLIRRRHK